MSHGPIQPEPQLTAQSVTLLLRKMRGKDEAAIASLWEKYWVQLVMAAQRQCQFKTAMVDPEFIAQSVFRHVCDYFQADNFSEISNREQFWAILLNLTKNKAIDHFRRETRLKRGGQGNRFSLNDDEQRSAQGPLATDHSNQQRAAAELLEHFQHSLDQEDDSGTLTQILLGRLAGESNSGIAENLGVSTRTIERKIERIRLVLEASYQ